MLVSTSLVAGPMAMGVDPGDSPIAHAVATTSVAQPDGSVFSNHAVSDMPDRACCGDPMVQGCDCHSVCASVVHSVAVSIPTPVFFAIVYRLPSPIRAPSPNTVAPLRPPLV
ncbi:MAG: hypothetical protein EPN32_05975 [Rhodanobacter sp.]|nr:MAG: hypothetical protein EPN58_04105 [Rhodanobacter sp.]TAN26776.1 MAG: hypothetical protein EPN32_05975 [Rhodanobacter sp.]